MSTEQQDAMSPEQESGNDDRMPNPGSTLQAAREAKGLSTAEAAASLRLPEKILIHLEAGRFESLPGDTFARGYVRSYARLLDLDANRLVLEYDRSRGIEVRERQVSGIDKIKRPGKAGGMLVTWTTVIVALAILASILLWWYDSRPAHSIEDVTGIASQVLDEVEVDAMALPEDFATDPALTVENADGLPAPAVATTDVESGSVVAVDSVESDNATQATDAEEAAAVEPSVPEQPAQQPAAPAATATESTPPETADPMTAAGGLQMQFTGDCWVQVTTPGGESLHSGLMRAGQSISVEHQGPVDVVIGAVEAVSKITFNGEPVNTQSIRQSGVVRLRLG